MKLETDSTPLPREADVVVIGGGIAGFSTALHTAQLLPGYRIVVLEKQRVICDGATGRNGGHLVPSWHGPRDVLEYEHECVRQIDAFVRSKGVDCELRFGGFTCLTSTADELKEFRKEFDALENRDGLRWLNADECKQHMKTDIFLGGVHYTKCAQLWGSKLVYGIARECQKLGVTIRSGAEVVAVDTAADGSFIVTTATKPTQSKLRAR